MATLMEISIGIKKTNPSTEKATESAANLCKSKYGNVIISKNPLDQKILEQELEKLDKKQKIREAEMFWKQRKFFIEKAFDEKEELRYAKLRNEKSKRSETERLTLPVIETPSSASSKKSSELTKQKRERTKISNAVFPKLVGTAKSQEKSRRAPKKEKSLLELKNRFDSIPPPILSCSPTFDLETKNETSPNPVLMPLVPSSQTDNLQYATNTLGQIQQVEICNDVERKNKKHKKNSKRQKEIEEKINNAETRIKDYANEENDEISMPIRDNLKLHNFDEDTHSVLMKIMEHTYTASQELDDLKMELENLRIRDDLRTSKSKLFSKSSHKLTTDELLLKLTMSLPLKLLLKTDQTLNDLSTALGFEDRRNKLLQRERTIVNKSALQDDRFKKLLSSLEKQNEDWRL